MTYAVRKMSSTGDYVFGHGSADYYRDVPNAVGQRAGTRLRMFAGEWFLDLTDGTPWFQEILQHNDYALAAAVLLDRIVSTPFAVSVENFNPVFKSADRSFDANGLLHTQFGIVYFSYPVKPGDSGPFQLGVTPIGGGGLG